MEVMTENKVLEFVTDFKLPETISSVRKQALDALNGMDFPTTRVEDWKYTRVARYVNKKYKQSQDTADIQEFIIEDLNAHQLVFVNGYLDESLSIIKEGDDALSIQKIEDLDEEYYASVLEDVSENVFSLINKAYQTGGSFIQIKKDSKLKFPIHMIHVTKGEGVIANARHFVHIASGSKAEIVATFNSIDSADSFTNIVFEGHVEENANLTISKLQTEENNVFHIAKDLFVQDKGSEFTMNTVTTGGSLVRNTVEVIVEGQNCHTELNGVYLGTERQLIDNHTIIDQMEPNCTSDELYKGVMDDKSAGVFNGKVIVREDAQKISAYQSNQNILLGEGARVSSKPELEIFADDVVCTHGSTIGDLDEDALFYLRTRGISKEKAKQMLISAFIGDVIERVDNEAVKTEIDKIFYKNFGWSF